ncbi:MAG: right-handed parallel beta-helix repeat-containing protein [Rhodobacteraceae bacterium]|nr:right-handed parallel beta-helix repeat-containing protein [Paracoccaceae bacterium]
MLLVPGNYGAPTIRNLQGNAAAPIVLRSADPARPAEFTGLILRDATHVTLSSLLFDYSYSPDDAPNFRPFQVLSSHAITIRNSVFLGDVARGVSNIDDGFGTGFGLGVRFSSSIRIQENEVSGFFRGFVITESQDVLVLGNDIHSIRMDGMNFAQVAHVLIENNHIHDFARSAASTDHPDMIQFWTSRTREPSRDIVIRSNVFNSGDGLYTQTIFMRNEEVDTGRAGREMFYRDITIADNVIINAHLHGISIGQTDGLIIRNNTVVRNTTSQGEAHNPRLWTPQIRVVNDARNVEISRNVVSEIQGYERQQDWQVHDNLFVQNSFAAQPGFYGKVFVDGALRNPTRIQSFFPRPGGPLDGSHIGASLLARH